MVAARDLRMPEWGTILITAITAVGAIYVALINHRQGREVAQITTDRSKDSDFMQGLARELAAVRERVRTLETEIRTLEKQLDDRAREVLALTAERDSLRLKIELLGADNADLKSRVLELETDLARRQSVIDELRASVDRLRSARQHGGPDDEE